MGHLLFSVPVLDFLMVEESDSSLLSGYFLRLFLVGSSTLLVTFHYGTSDPFSRVPLLAVVVVYDEFSILFIVPSTKVFSYKVSSSCFIVVDDSQDHRSLYIPYTCKFLLSLTTQTYDDPLLYSNI